MIWQVSHRMQGQINELQAKLAAAEERAEKAERRNEELKNQLQVFNEAICEAQLSTVRADAGRMKAERERDEARARPARDEGGVR